MTPEVEQAGRYGTVAEQSRRRTRLTASGVGAPAPDCSAVPPGGVYPPRAVVPCETSYGHAIATAVERRGLGERVEADVLARGYARATAELYGAAAAEALRFYAEERGRRTVEAVDTADVRAYCRATVQRAGRRPGRPGAGPLTRRAAWRLLRGGAEAFAVLVRAGELASDPASGVEVAGYLPEDVEPERVVLTEGQVGALYAAADELPPGRWPRRARAVLALAYGCGLRAAELTALRVGDVRLAERRVVVRAGKGGRRRVVPLGPGVLRDLEGYLFGERRAVIAAGAAWGGSSARAAHADAVLVNDHGRAMRGYTANSVLAGLTEAAGLVDEVTGEPVRVRCHALRHSLATHLLARGVATEHLRLMLGHASVDTTQVYAAVSAEALRGVDLSGVYALDTDVLDTDVRGDG